MADHAPTKDDSHGGGGGGGDLKKNLKFFVFFIFIFITIAAAVIIVLLDQTSAQNFIYFLQGIGIILLIYLAYNGLLLYRHMKKFEHYTEEINHIFHERHHKEKKTTKKQDPLISRFEKAKKHITSEYREEWKIGIIELDTILKDLLVRNKFKGDTVGELLDSAKAKGFNAIDLAWEAHKIRNRVVHEGVSFEMSNDMAMQALRKYTTAFNELGIQKE